MAGTRADARKAREDLGRVAETERRREVVQDALACIYSGAGFLEADALLDALGDRGARIEMQT